MINRRQMIQSLSLLAVGGLVGCSTASPVPQAQLGMRPILLYTDLKNDRPATIAAWRFQDNHRDTIIAGRLTIKNAEDTFRVAERRLEAIWGGTGYIEPVSSRHPGIDNAPVWVITPVKQSRMDFISSYSLKEWFDGLRETAAQLHLSDYRLPTHSLHLVLHRDAITERKRGKLRLAEPLEEEALMAARLAGWPANMITVQYRLRSRTTSDHFVLKPVFKGNEAWALYPAGLESQIM